MKTKIIVFVAMSIFSITGFSNTGDPTPWFTISRNEDTGIYLIKYQGSKISNVIVTIKDSRGNEISSTTVRAARDFSLPINLSSVSEEMYTIQIDNGTEKVIQTLDYKNEKAPTYTHVTNLGNKHYLFTASHSGIEKILIAISDGNGIIVYQENKVITGDQAIIFDLTSVSGKPSFDITEESGHSLMIPGSPQVIAIKK